jgi:AraC-like DNA-binding protein
MALFGQIFQAVKDQDPSYQARAGASIFMLLAEVVGSSQRSEFHRRSGQLVEQAKFAMHEKIYDTIDLAEFCRNIGSSPSHLGIEFKAYTGMTPYQYFINIKINKAKEFLQTKELSIKEIAFKLGFQDQYYFSRLFKKKTGMSPSQWGAV